MLLQMQVKCFSISVKVASPERTLVAKWLDPLSLLLVADSVRIWWECALVCILGQGASPTLPLCGGVQSAHDWALFPDDQGLEFYAIVFSILDIVIHIYSQTLILVLVSLCVVCLVLRILPGI